jgi:hypothetical protein
MLSIVKFTQRQRWISELTWRIHGIIPTGGNRSNGTQKTLSQCHFFPHKSHAKWPGINPGLRCEKLATQHLSYCTAGTMNLKEMRRKDMELTRLTQNMGQWQVL